jgi:predicted RNase H-like HicB family nuclease
VGIFSANKRLLVWCLNLQREKIMLFKAIVHEEDGMFWAEVPSLPGCATQGETLEELKVNLKEAIEGVLDVDIDMSAVELEKASVLEIEV